MRTVAQTGSTNADMLALAAAGASEGLWLRAECQSAGRGRQGRAWVSPPGNLYATTLVRLRTNDPPAPGLALVAGIAVWEAVSVHVPAGLVLKWPNDLLLSGAKVAGILLERADDAVVIGLGVNVAHHPGDLARPVTSLAAHGVTISAVDLLNQVAGRFSLWLERWRENGFAPIRAAWLAHAHPIGTPLSTARPDGTAVNGRFEDLAPDGALVLRLASGARHVIHAGDVFVV